MSISLLFITLFSPFSNPIVHARDGRIREGEGRGKEGRKGMKEVRKGEKKEGKKKNKRRNGKGLLKIGE